DQNRFVINLICPVGSSIDYVDEMLARGERIMMGLRDPVTGKEVVATFYASTSIRPGSLITEGIMFIRLIPADQRSWTQSDVMDQVRQAIRAVPGVRAVVLDLSTQGFTSTRGFPIDFAVQGPDWDTVTALSERIRERMTSSGFLTDINSDYRPGQAEVRLYPDRAKAAELGVSMRRLGLAMSIGQGGVRG